MSSKHVVVNTLPIAAQLKHRSAQKFIAADRARIAKLVAGHSPHGPNVVHSKQLRRRVHEHKPFAKHHHKGSASAAVGDTIDVTDAGVTYTAQVGVGSPATNYTLLIDTGSSNTWVGADKKTPGKTITVSYGSGSFSGEEYTDQVTLGTGLVIQKQGLGVASTSQGFSGQDGILGIGPVDLTEGTVSGGQTVPTVTDNLFAQKTISSNSVGISYVPTTGDDGTTGVANGELTFGGTDSSKFTGEINFVPITQTSPASMYWGIDQSITYGSADGTTILSQTAGIVDTGTTLLYLASDAVPGIPKRDRRDCSTKRLACSRSTSDQLDNLQSLFFNIGGTTYEFTANAQIWPRSLNSTLGGSTDAIYLVAADNGTPSGQGLDFINGFAWLQRFYTVFDTQNSQIGIATTEFTNATTN
ncbi:acid protease [Phellopilus nigrolimitatus]|nr:acid protease [Phellopilus nigrolimitatus]